MGDAVAIISDIHANQDALEAVFADIEGQGVSEVLCLGDIVGYGIDAQACVDMVQERCSLCLCGNHDWALLHDAAGFNPVARGAIEVTRHRIRPGRFPSASERRRWAYLEGLPQREERGDWLLVHGSPRDPVTEYVFPEDVALAPEKMAEIFELFDGACFVGHTHVPGVFTEDMQFLPPSDVRNGFELGGGRALVNVGSVGQPRDRDPRACYVVIAEDRVHYRRVDYDVQRTQERIRASRIDNLCAERLALGR